MDFLLVTDGDKLHYVYIRDSYRFMFYKTKNKKRKYFGKSYLQCFSCKNVLRKHKEVCLSINGVQSVRLEKGTSEFKNHLKQIPVPFKIYADFECNSKGFESYETYSKSVKITFLVVILITLFVLMVNLIQSLFFKVKILLINLSNNFVKNLNTLRK